MATSVRLYSHGGLTTPPVTGSNGRFTSDSLFLLRQPYLAGEVLSASASATASAAATCPDGTTLVHIQIAPGARCHYECTPANATLTNATTNSPIIEGSTQVQAGPGWRFSFVEAATTA